MAKVEIPFVGVSMDDKTLLFVLAGLGVFVWLVKSDLERKIGGAVKTVAEAVKENITKPADVLYDVRHPQGVNPETGFSNTDYWQQSFSFDWLKQSLWPSIEAAEAGEYFHRSDRMH